MDAVAVVGTASVIVSGLVAAVTYLFFELQKSRKVEAKCQAEVAAIRAELLGLNTTIEVIRLIGDPEIVAEVVADAGGMVREWSAGATMLLHWSQRDMLGKHITTIVPARYREKHAAGFEQVRASGRSPRHGPFLFHALAKEGAEVPVTIRLTGWQEGGQACFGAVMMRRAETPEEVAAREKAGSPEGAAP